MKNDKKATSYILTRETFGAVLLVFSALVLVALTTHQAVFAGIGKAICTFMYGTFGYGCYLLVALCAYIGVWLLFEKKIKISIKTLVIISITLYVVFMLFHAVSTNGYELSSFGNYLSSCYNNAEKGYAGYTFGGMFSGLLVFPVAKATTFIGAYIIFSILSVLCGYLTYLSVKAEFFGGKTSAISVEEDVKPEGYVTIKNDNIAPPEYVNQPVVNANQVNYSEKNNILFANYGEKQNETIQKDEDKFSAKNLGNKIIFKKGEFDAESYRRNMIFNENSYFNNPVHNEGDYLKSFSDGSKKNDVPAPNQTYTQSYEKVVENQQPTPAPSSYVYGGNPVESLIDEEKVNEEPIQPVSYDFTNKVEEPTDPVAFDSKEEQTPPIIFDNEEVEEVEEVEPEIKVNDQPITPPQPTPSEDSTPPLDFNRIRNNENPQPQNKREEGRSGLFDLFSSNNPNLGERRIDINADGLNNRRDRSNANLFDESDSDEDTDTPTQRGVSTPPERATDINLGGRGVMGESSRITPETEKPMEVIKRQPEKPAEEKGVPAKHVWDKYVRPGVDLLVDYPENTNFNHAEIEESKQIIVDTLARVRIESEISNVVLGPAITRYDVTIKDNANIKNSIKYRDSIAMALKKDNVNCYLNFGKGALSIEVPNTKQGIVGLKNMLVSNQYMNCKPNGLTFALGQNYDGEAVCPDITKMPHLLVAGTSGSGKSVCLRALIVSLLYKYGPEDLRFILVDPKQAEFIPYDKLPHLMINEIISDVDKAIKALNWAINEMERRYKLFREMTESGVAIADLGEYNSRITDPADKLPKIVMILDEFGDLMLQARKDIEMRIVRLVQKARAAGIHLILATQRPSVDCITGLIKSNLSTRIGFKVGSNNDSMTIFDVAGAEKLIGNGDMFYRTSKGPELHRIQGCFIELFEAQAVADFVKANNKPFFDQSVADFINKVEEPEVEESLGGDSSAGDSDMKVDDLFIKALKYCVESNQASVSMIQRRFPCGYIKACKIIDWMTNMNYITPPEGSKPRKVLLSRDEFINVYGEIED
ncbi:MAG: hypothetical protein J6B04_05005 [Clostridia bacterium]|nr:hypothetical protein [Clostridia bacterium]